MKDTKKWRNRFDIYDKYRLTEYFEAQAREGWILQSYSGSKFLFRRSEPQNLHYCVVFYPDGITYDTKPTESQKILYDFCAHTGWELVAASGYIQVFCNAQEDPVPIETEPEVELANIHKFYISYQKTRIHFYCAVFPVFAMRIASLLRGNQNTGNVIFDVATIIFWGGYLLDLLIEYINYRLWYRKAMQSIDMGIEIPRAINKRIRSGIVHTVLWIGIAMMVLSIIMNETPQMAFVILLLTMVMILVCMGIGKLLKGRLFDSFGDAFKYHTTVWVVTAVTIILVGIVLAL